MIQENFRWNGQQLSMTNLKQNITKYNGYLIMKYPFFLFPFPSKTYHSYHTLCT